MELKNLGQFHGAKLQPRHELEGEGKRVCVWGAAGGSLPTGHPESLSLFSGDSAPALLSKAKAKALGKSIQRYSAALRGGQKGD